MDFLDPNKPMKVCKGKECSACDSRNNLHCHFTGKDLMYFYLIVLPSFLLGGAGIFNVSAWGLIPWLIIIVGFFGFVEIRVLCSHCPHYAEDGKTLKCGANYGSPKLWKYRPEPMSFWEKFTLFAGFGLVWGFPVVFMLFKLQVFTLIVYALTTAGFFTTLRTFLCSQCINFACPLNTVKNRPDFGR
jgi:hypothetical protein